MTIHVWLRRGAPVIGLALLGIAFSRGPLAIGQQRGERRAAPSPVRGLDRLVDDVANLQSADRAPISVNQRRPTEIHIIEALKETTDVDATEQPLADVIEYLKDRHQIEIQIDGRALQDAGLGSDTPITRNVQGISLASLLDLLLSEYELTYLIHDEVLLITSDQAANNMPETRVYPVGDLIAASDPKGKSGDRYEALVETVVDAIGGQASKKLGSVRSYRPSAALVVHQPQPVHRKIEDVLSQLRRAQQLEAARTMQR